MVGIYKFVGELPARMGEAMSEAQGRGIFKKNPPFRVGGWDFQYRAAGAPYSPSRNEGRRATERVVASSPTIRRPPPTQNAVSDETAFCVDTLKQA